MALSILIPYQTLEDTSNLRNCLRTLSEQTILPRDIWILDDSLDWLPVDKVIRQAQKADLPVRMLHSAYRPKPQWAHKFNTGIQYTEGNKVMLLCANWLLAKYALEVMERALDATGPGHIVVSDSQRQQMCNAQGQPIDWFKSFAVNAFNETKAVLPDLSGGFNIFEMEDFNHIDVGYLTVFHKEDWLPFDEDFDEVGGWHAVIEWGYRLIHINKKKLNIVRGLIAWHQPAGFTYNTAKGNWIAQTAESQRLLHKKIPGIPPE